MEHYKLELLNKLQKTLDLTTIIKTFAATVQKAITFDSIHYSYMPCKIELNFPITKTYNAKQKTNTVDYSMVLDTVQLGKLKLTRSYDFKEHEKDTLNKFIEILCHPVNNSLLYHIAIQNSLHDPLTKVGNRRSLNAALEREQQIARRYRSPLSLLMIDIDNLKYLNDNLGHLTGDNIIKQIANIITICVRNSDIVFRYGGDEFTVILNGTNFIGAHQLAQRMHDITTSNLTNYNAKFPSNMQLSISIGLAPFLPTDTIQSFLQRADNALYRAKKKGKNCIYS